MNTRGKLAASAAVLALMGAVALYTAQRSAPSGAGTEATGQTASGWGMLRPGMDPASPDAHATASTGPLTPEQVRTRLFKQGSFVGTEPAGDWCIAAGKLSACAGLRGKFEYYILGLGEVTIEEIRGLVADEAARAHGPHLAAQIMAIWDKYWQLRTHTWRTQFDQADRSTWLPVFEEQRLVRRQMLGADWAKAFYAQDEQAFLQYQAQLESGAPPPPDPGEPVPQMAPGKDPAAVHAERVARYGQAAADRLAKADDEWADWERRLAAARLEWTRLQGAANLSDAQRKQDIAAYVKAHFKANELLRVQALLNL